MPDNTQRNLGSTPVRWTDDEWLQIARGLCAKQGGKPMDTLNLQKIKARDVFLAQEVLPKDRHRKLGSIAQGFEGIRARLNGMIQKPPHGDQNQLFRGQYLETRQGRHAQQTQDNMSGHSTDNVGVSYKNATARAVRMEVDPERQPPLKAGGTVSRYPAQAAYANEVTAEREGGAAEQAPKCNVMPERQVDVSAHQAAPDSGMPPDRPAGPSLTEMARPFIGMICEELAKALVNAMSAQGADYPVPAESHPDRSGPATSQEEAFHAHADGEVLSELSHNSTNEEGEDPSEIDVQPLFDPKLPPSANSDFKPQIGLVTTPGNDFEGLRQLYPQLHLTIGQADAISDVRRFGHCQRIIALRDAISPATDELLSRLLRHRYIRLW